MADKHKKDYEDFYRNSRDYRQNDMQQQQNQEQGIQEQHMQMNQANGAMMRGHDNNIHGAGQQQQIIQDHDNAPQWMAPQQSLQLYNEQYQNGGNMQQQQMNYQQMPQQNYFEDDQNYNESITRINQKFNEMKTEIENIPITIKPVPAKGTNNKNSSANADQGGRKQVSKDQVDQLMEPFKSQKLPLARIKKIMKSDEEVRMISAEAPILFAKACEMFITEMTIKGYYNAEKADRKTLQRKDIAVAIARTETYDFLIDTIPKEELFQHVPKESFSMYQNSLINRNTMNFSNDTQIVQPPIQSHIQSQQQNIQSQQQPMMEQDYNQGMDQQQMQQQMYWNQQQHEEAQGNPNAYGQAHLQHEEQQQQMAQEPQNRERERENNSRRQQEEEDDDGEETVDYA